MEQDIIWLEISKMVNDKEELVKEFTFDTKQDLESELANWKDKGYEISIGGIPSQEVVEMFQ